MMRSYFLGAGLRTNLGAGVARNVDALLGAPPAPRKLQVRLGDLRESVPALLYSDAPLEGPEQRMAQVADAVIVEALDQAGLTAAERREAAFVLGTSSLDISTTEAAYQSELAGGLDAHPLTSNSSMGAVAEDMRRRLGLVGPDYTFCTACTASANALMCGDALVRSGRVRHAVVVGAEFFNFVTALGFHSLGLLAPAGMKPFDRARAGLVPGEACAALVLGAEPRGEDNFHLRGGANLCDTYGITAANPDGSTVAAVIRQALDASAVVPDRIAAIKAHGTASLLNDEAEAAGMRRVFPDLPPLCVLKPFIGHTFGACGLSELVLFCAMAERGLFPGSPGVCAEPSDLEIRLNQAPTPLSPGIFMLNYFGFGGNNTSLVIANVAR
jgi:3-oxoacyl-[acyl-carrier-protein] synthase-1